MKRAEKRQMGGRSSSLRQTSIGFFLGAVTFGVAALVVYTQKELQIAVESNDLAHDSLIPPPPSKCNCEKQQSTSIRNSLVEIVEETIDVVEEHNPPFPDFDPDAPAVIVTKIQGESTVGSLNQMLCLLKYAYNDRVKYDVVVFSADPLSDENLATLEATVAPANFTFVVDNPGLQKMVDALPEYQRKFLLERCNNATSSADLNWRTRCNETTSSGTTVMPIGYNWQAEFRSLHIWKHPALANYKYMMWLDTDAFCTKVWQQDPISIMRKNDLVLLFDKFPAGRANGLEWINKTIAAFGHRICEIAMTDGKLRAVKGYCKRAKFLRQVYGFFHVTNLDFYRSEPVMNWQQIMIGDGKFSRNFDDQIGVTMPAAVYAGNRSWDMRYHGLKMSVMHNFVMDGNTNEKTGSYFRFWEHEAKNVFPEAFGKCSIVARG